MMLGEMRQHMEEFHITVQYYRRNYCYKVKHQILKNGENIFHIIAGQKTVVLTFNRPQISIPVFIDYKQYYSYDELEITNKGFMDRIIEAIDKYTIGR